LLTNKWFYAAIGIYLIACLSSIPYLASRDWMEQDRYTGMWVKLPLSDILLISFFLFILFPIMILFVGFYVINIYSISMWIYFFVAYGLLIWYYKKKKAN
jgi:cytosine/uracil/thiamine/allantoin permease